MGLGSFSNVCFDSLKSCGGISISNSGRGMQQVCSVLLENELNFKG